MPEFGDEIDSKFPLGLSREEKAALIWKIEQDYVVSNYGAVSFKEEYITFAINFYTRTPSSLQDVIAQHRAFRTEEYRRARAQAFIADLKSQLAELEDMA